jgi:transcriptional regulator with XRE-family HTH domain
MARAALCWSLDDLAAAAGVNRKTILRFEQGESTPRSPNLEAVRRAFEMTGVRFAAEGGVLPPGSGLPNAALPAQEQQDD